MSLRHILRGPDLGPNELGKKAGACIMLESSNLTLGILGGPEEFKQGQDRGKFSVRNTILIAVYIEHRRVGQGYDPVSGPCAVLSCFSHIQLFVTLQSRCSPPGSPVHGILQERIPEWVAVLSSRGYSQPRDRT